MVAYDEYFGSIGHSLDVLVVQRFVDEVSVDGDADLPLMEEPTEDCDIDGQIDVGVRKDDVRVVTAEFERYY